MRSSILLFCSAILIGLLIVFLPKQSFHDSMSFLISREGIGLLTAIIGAIVALWINKSKFYQNKIQFTVEENMKKFSERVDELNASVQEIKHDFDEMKLGKATRENYESQLNNVISTSINYFSINDDLQCLIRIFAEEFKKYCNSIQEHDLKNIKYSDLKQSGIVFSDEYKLKCIKLMGEEYANEYHKFFLEDWKKFMKKLKFILDDKVNNKNYRFFTASVDFLQTSMSKSLQFWLDYMEIS